MATTIKKHEEILDILSKACARRELLILVTPYLRFESSFVAIQGDEIHVLATMSREDAVYGLRVPDLKMRFPHGLGFYEGAVSHLGLGLHEGRHTVKLSVPKVLRENEQRGAYRVERVGRVPVTFGTPRANIILASLVDISVTGAQFHAQREIPATEVAPGDKIFLDIPLSEEISIHSAGTVRHLDGRKIGIQFTPALPPDIEAPLSKWAFRMHEEERERAARRLEEAPSRELRTSPAVPVSSLLLVSPDAGLESDLREVLKDIKPLTRLAPAVQELKEALQGKPSLIIFHLEGAGLDERRRLKTLTEIAQRKAPTLLLGTGVDGATLFELSSEWKASSAIAWSPERTLFLQRLVQGMLRRHITGGESPVAPMEDSS